MEIKLKELTELNELYDRADMTDKKVFAEMKSNILLINNEHYKKYSTKLDATLRNAGVSKDRRLRLTKNHTQKITSDIKDIFVSQMSAFKPCPRNENEMSDSKAAELANSVWQWGSEKIEWDDFVDRAVNSFVDIGEVGSKVFWDPNAGDIKGYNQKVTAEGLPLFQTPDGQITTQSQDQMGLIKYAPLADKSKPVFSGRLLVEPLYCFNLLRDPSAQLMKNSPVVIYRHMKDLKAAKLLAKDEETKNKVIESANRTYKIFDSTSGEFYDSKNQVMIREFYYRPCHEYPRGYFYICTEDAILDHGEIPFGDLGEIAFPIKHTGYDIIETSPRYASPIRPLRPLQAEVNRTASSEAETQITMGPDKVFLKVGGTITKGAEMAGMRAYHTSGPAPTVVPGRSGQQYVGTLERAISEMYLIAKLPENANPTANVTDPRSELYKSVRQKARFSRQLSRLERYFKSIVNTWIFLAQKYLDDQEVIKATGKSEAVNIPEFKQIESSDLAIKIEPVSGDYNTMFGKSLEIEMIAQYLGKDLPDDMKAALVRSLPFMNKEPVIQQLMTQYDAPMNMLLALDRGEDHIPNKYSDETVMLKALYLRLQKADYDLLPPEVQAKYAEVITAYEEIAAMKAEEALRLQKGMIPTGGNLVKVDYYIMDENGKQIRGTFPSESLDWLKETIAAQGMAQERLEQMANSQGLVDIGSQVPSLNEPNMQQQQIPMEGMNGSF